MFAAAFPLAPALAYCNNVLELRVDACKLCFHYRKPEGERARSVGVLDHARYVWGRITRYGPDRLYTRHTHGRYVEFLNANMIMNIVMHCLCVVLGGRLARCDAVYGHHRRCGQLLPALRPAQQRRDAYAAATTCHRKQHILVFRIGRIVPMGDDYLLGSVSSTVPENRSVVSRLPSSVARV